MAAPRSLTSTSGQCTGRIAVMELRHLRTIAAVARHGSLTKAGEELYLSQSAISQQIRRLELELGFDVFRRTSRSVELTAEGRVILACAKRVLAEVDGLHNELEELTGLLGGQLRIGGVYPTGPYDLFGMLAAFRTAHPVHLHRDGRGARTGEQGPGRRGDPALGGRAAGAADRAASDRPRAAHVAGGAGLARRAPPEPGRQGVPEGRAGVRRAHRAPVAARGVTTAPRAAAVRRPAGEQL